MKTEINKPVHVLFADDDADESYLFKEALEHLSLNVTFTHVIDGNALLEYLNTAQTPDLVFLDLNMPYKDGTEALEEIRKMPKFEKLPLIIYSTANNKGYIDACLAKGASRFVIKPTSFNGIMKVINAVLSINWKLNQIIRRDNFVISDGD